MSSQVRQPRTRGGGGRTLMLLGVILALAAGILVIYVVSTAGPGGAHQVTVVVAAKDITASTILTASDTSDPSHTKISEAFTTKSVNSDFVPQGAYNFVSTSELNIYLNDQVVTGQFFAGDILRAADPRLAKVGSVSIGSLTFRNPAALPKGSVLFPLKVENAQNTGLVAGDHVDVLVTYAVSSNSVGNSTSGNASLGGQESQTTLENVYIYAVAKDGVYVVLTHQDALTLKLLTETAKVTLAIRKPGDNDPANTVPATGQYIYQHFHFVNP